MTAAADLPQGCRFCLPSEAEWEKAARGEFGNEWPWGNEFDPARCNSSEGGPGNTTPVDAYIAQGGNSPYGAADMVGNIWEWTRSLWGSYPYPADLKERAKREDENAFGDRVVRGGAFFDDCRDVRGASRYYRGPAHPDYYSDPGNSLDSVGFRVCVSHLPNSPSGPADELERCDPFRIRELVEQVMEREPDPDGPQRRALCERLVMVACNTEIAPPSRAAAADGADQLGYIPEDLYSFVQLHLEPKMAIARYPVTNLQYIRFLASPDHRKKEFWLDFPQFDEEGRPMKDGTGSTGWEWLEETGRKVKEPDAQSEPKFGASRHLVPVVMVSWYEANAYCKWLLAHWEDMEEGKRFPKPKQVRLPTRQEWVTAAGGEEPEMRFPWDDAGKAGTISGDDKVTIAEVVKRANVSQSKINWTTPVWMYPQGVSHPYDLMDLGGNAWEWMASYGHKERNYLGLSGGSWNYVWEVAHVSARLDLHPNRKGYYLGFRIILIPS